MNEAFSYHKVRQKYLGQVFLYNFIIRWNSRRATVPECGGIVIFKCYMDNSLSNGRKIEHSNSGIHATSHSHLYQLSNLPRVLLIHIQDAGSIFVLRHSNYEHPTVFPSSWDRKFEIFLKKAFSSSYFYHVPCFLLIQLLLVQREMSLLLF